VHALGNEFGGFLITIGTDSNTIRQEGPIIDQHGEHGIDFQSDIEISADNVTAYLAGEACGQHICAGALFFFNTERAVTEQSLPLPAVPRRIALTAADRFALLALPAAESVAVVDLATRRLVGQIELRETVYDVGTTRNCVGDCDGSGDVDVDELIAGVRAALGFGDVQECSAVDRNHTGPVEVEELVAATRNALEGC
jgi:hypothetical protein